MTGRRLVLALLAGALPACATGQGSGAAMTARDIDAVLAAHRDALMARPGVVGTAVGLCDGKRCIKVLFADSTTATRSNIPTRLEGYRVVAEVTGPLRPR